MLTYSSVLFALSAAIIALLGAVHLYYTLASNKFHPRDADLKERLESVSPVLTGQTTSENSVLRLGRRTVRKGSAFPRCRISFMRLRLINRRRSLQI